MKRAEFLSRLIVTVAVIGVVGTPLYLWPRTPIIHARMAENGGWTPDVIQAEAGRPLHLKLTSDVMHGFAVGQMDMDGVNVEPGKVTELTLTFDKPGIYTFYRTRWCGLNHWRMRGTIEVSGSPSDPEPVSPAVDQQKIEYGDQHFGTSLTFDIKVTNTGDGTLRFKEEPYIQVLEGC